MAENPHQGRAAADPMQNVGPNEYMDWFKDSPDPWKEVAKLDFGSDRSFASAVELLVLNASQEQWPKLEHSLLDALAASSGQPAAVDFLCEQLALIGGEACVESLAALLVDPATTDAARVALQPNPSAAVNPVLRDALGKLSDGKLCGLIGTIAARGDREARTALEQIAADSAQPERVRDTAKSAALQLRS